MANPPPTSGLTIVVPCYNEADRLGSDDFESFSREHPEYGFAFVDDGSSDGTGERLEELTARLAGPAEVLTHVDNQGKAAAVRTGVLHAANQPGVEAVGYWDADLSTPLDEIPRFAAVLRERPEVSFLLGCRHLRLGVTIRRSMLRHYLGRIFATAASNVLGLPVYDTQCGAKMVRSALAREIFAEELGSRWLFDVELLARVIARDGREAAADTVYELTLERWVDPGGSKLKASDFLKAPAELWSIRQRYRQWLRQG